MKRQNSQYGVILNVLCLILLVGTFVYLAKSWQGIPDTIPGHYNAAGEVDRWGAKGELLILPVINWILYFIITAVERAPQVWNTGVKVTEENKERVYKILENMISTVKLMTVAIFTYLTINTALAMTLSPWFFPVSLILTFGTVAYFISRLFKVR